MRSVLISIRPEWCALIARGVKTIEVRKTKPKLDTPFKCYIYCTKGKFEPSEHLRNNLHYDDSTIKVCEGQGKVIGEFVCNCIECFTTDYRRNEEQTQRISRQSCVDMCSLMEYEANAPCLYGWHISNLVIYDEPKPLNHLFCECKHYDTDSDSFCYGCPYFYEESNESVGYYSECLVDGYIPIKKPPQSWCYVEDLP